MEKITITLGVNEWNVIMASLGKAPYETVAPVVAAIQEQAKTQMSAAVAQAEDVA